MAQGGEEAKLSRVNNKKGSLVTKHKVNEVRFLFLSYSFSLIIVKKSAAVMASFFNKAVKKREELGPHIPNSPVGLSSYAYLSQFQN